MQQLMILTLITTGAVSFQCTGTSRLAMGRVGKRLDSEASACLLRSPGASAEMGAQPGVIAGLMSPQEHGCGPRKEVSRGESLQDHTAKC